MNSRPAVRLWINSRTIPEAYGIGLYGFVKDYNEVMTAAVMQDLSGSVPPSGGCINSPSLDWNGDCKVDFIDFANFASEWMACGLKIAIK